VQPAQQANELWQLLGQIKLWLAGAVTHVAAERREHFTTVLAEQQQQEGRPGCRASAPLAHGFESESERLASGRYARLDV
jgi:hypothetical protein